MSEREVLTGPQVSVPCWNDGHEHCSGIIRLWSTGESGRCLCPCHDRIELKGPTNA